LKSRKNNSGISLRELAEKTASKVDGNGDVVITGVAPIETAGAGDITFVANKRYLKYLESTNASAVVLDEEAPCSRLSVIRNKNPYLTFAKIVDVLCPDQTDFDGGVDSTAIVADSAQVSPGALIGPLCHIGAESRIGDKSRLMSSVYIGEGVTIGSNCLLYPGVRVMNGTKIGNNVIIHPSAVIGSDGFGFAESETGLKKIKQVGWVEVDDEVEIGANTTIDRGALGPTRIGRGTKIDNLVQIAHNVEIGQNCIIVAQVGISGSTKLGNGVVLAGQVGLVGHIEIGDGVKVGAQSGISKSVEPGKMMFGYPAREIMQTKRIEASLTRLPDLLKRVKKIEDKLSD
jgi:UDP-3-O-[3-hydroxymyristoyl] glucosamine N-acyltransferase